MTSRLVLGMTASQELTSGTPQHASRKASAASSSSVQRTSEHTARDPAGIFRAPRRPQVPARVRRVRQPDRVGKDRTPLIRREARWVARQVQQRALRDRRATVVGPWSRTVWVRACPQGCWGPVDDGQGSVPVARSSLPVRCRRCRSLGRGGCTAHERGLPGSRSSGVSWCGARRTAVHGPITRGQARRLGTMTTSGDEPLCPMRGWPC